MENEYCFAWWNVENLFDVKNSPNRPDWLQKQLKRELEGWNASQLNTKIKQLVKVIAAMNDDKGPDLLGCCEVESLGVLEKLLCNVFHWHQPAQSRTRRDQSRLDDNETRCTAAFGLRVV